VLLDVVAGNVFVRRRSAYATSRFLDLLELLGRAFRPIALIAAMVGVPIGTVMSRLACGRERLQTVLKLSSHRETLR